MMPQERRLSTRKTPEHLTYLSLPMNNGGIVVDVSEGGLGFRAITPVEADGPIHFRFAIDSGKRIKAVGELAWKDETGKIGGLRFTQLSDETRDQIRVWASQSNAVMNSGTNESIFDVSLVESAIGAEVASHGKPGWAPGDAAGLLLPPDLQPPNDSAPLDKLSTFPLGLNSVVEAIGATVPQFIELFDEINEQVRDWVGQSKAGVYDNPFADPAFEAGAAPRNEEFTPFVNLSTGEPASESEYAPSGKSGLAVATDDAVAGPAMEAESASVSEADFDRMVAAGNPGLYNLRPPVYSARFNPLSMFPQELGSEAAALTAEPPQSAAFPAPIVNRHPVAAIGVTIVLAFLVSMGIIAYASTSRAGKFLLDWGEEKWGELYSQPVPQNAAPPDRRLQDSSKTPQR